MIWKERDPLISERPWWPSCVSMGPNAGPAGVSIFFVRSFLNLNDLGLG